MRRSRRWTVGLVLLTSALLVAGCGGKPAASPSSHTTPIARVTPASSTSGPLQGRWSGQGTYNDGRSPFDMALIVQVNGSLLTGFLYEDTYDGAVSVQGTSTRSSNGSFAVRFTDEATVSGGLIALNTTYVTTVANGNMTGVWYFAGDTSPDGTLSLDMQSNQAPVQFETPAEQQAVNWAQSLIGLPQGQNHGIYWYGCLAFAVDAYVKGANYPAIRNQISIPLNPDSFPADIWPTNQTTGNFVPGWGILGTSETPPAGALVFWDSTHGTTLSHVAISIGGGEVISTNVDQNYVAGYDGIHTETMAQFAQNSWNIYKGWWLPDQ